MNELSKIIIISVSAIGIAAFIFVIIFNIRQSQYAYRVLFEDLKTFKYFVENCSIDPRNRDIIIGRLKIERARTEMEAADYGNMVNDIAQIYLRRFYQDNGGAKTQSHE